MKLKYYAFAFVILIFVFFTSGCTLDSLLTVADKGSKTYETVKNAQSLGKVADGVITLADTRKIKAETTKDFIKATETLIGQQDKKYQPELISQSIQAKVSIAKSNSWDWFRIGVLSGLTILGLILIIKYILDKAMPKKKSKTETY
jgi:hypothetical protein